MTKICTLTDPLYREKLIDTLNIVSNTVSSTLGPNGKTCILFNGEAVPHVTKDGVTVAEFIKFQDAFQEAINRVIKETARKTGEKVGDGTTTSILLACKLTEEILNDTYEGDTLGILAYVEDSITEVLKNLKESTTKLDIFSENTIDTLQAIVNMSSNGDKEITKFIIDTLKEIGADGLIDVMDSNNEITYVDIQDGMLIEAPAHVNKSINIEEPLVALVSNSINKVHEIKTCMQFAFNVYQESKKSLIIVAKEFSKEVQNVVLLNNRASKTSIFLVESDGFATNMYEVLDDMAAILDCKILSTDGNSEFGLQNMTSAHLSNNIKSAVVTPQHTILKHKEALTDENLEIKLRIIEEIAELKRTGENKLGEITSLEKRLSKFSKSATIYVGGFTDAEKLEKKDRVDDAVKALASAVNGGVIPGGGYSLFNASKDVESTIVRNVCMTPGILLSQNVNVDIKDIYSKGKVMDFVTQEVGDAFELGILDPADVAIKAVQQAMVIVKLLLNTHSIIIPDNGEIQR